MTDRTLTALYDSRSDADQAKSQLIACGLTDSRVTIADQSSMSQSSTSASSGDDGLFGGLKRFFGGDDHATYSEAVNRGGFLLTARVDDDYVDQAERILDESNAVDFDAREQEYRSSGWSPTTAQSTSQTAMQSQNTVGDAGTIQLAEERLTVGKREVERGGARVRSYVVETPVQEQVSLREEHVTVDRHNVENRPVTGAQADALFQDKTIEMTESAEVPVVSKEAFVREEIGIRKDVDQRTETISDTVRRTEVDVDNDIGERASFASTGETADLDLTDEERARRADPNYRPSTSL